MASTCSTGAPRLARDLPCQAGVLGRVRAHVDGIELDDEDGDGVIDHVKPGGFRR